MNNRSILFIIPFFILLLPLFVYAEESNPSLEASVEDNKILFESIRLLEKTDNVTEVSDAVIEDGQIKTNLIFHDIGDSVTYQLSIKNNSDKHYIIENIKDNNINPVIKYQYTSSNSDFDKNVERKIYLTISYQEEIPADSVLEDASFHLNDTVSIQLELSEFSMIDILNPVTNNNIRIIYFILFLFVFVFSLLFLKKAKKIVSIFLLMILSCSYPVKAENPEIIEISFNNQLEIPIHFVRNDWKSSLSNDYTKIVVSQEMEIPNDAVDVSEKQDGSVKAWVSDSTLYLASKYRMYLPIDSTAFFSSSVAISEIEFGDHSISSLFTNIFNNMFHNQTQVEEIDTSWIRTDNVTSLSNMFGNCSNLKKLDLSGWINPNINHIYSLMYGSFNLEEFNLSNWDNHKLENGTFSFGGLSLPNLKVLNLTNFDTKSLTSMNNMFGGINLNNLEELDLTTWDYSNITSMSGMFGGAKTAKINIGNIDSSSVTDMSSMFAGTSIQEINIGNIDAPELLTMNSMFGGSQTENITFKVINTPKLTSLNSMFGGTSKLSELIWESFDTSSVENVSYMFAGTNLTCIDLSELDFSSVTLADYLFNSSSIEEIVLPKVLPVENTIFDLPAVYKDDNNTEYVTIDNTIVSQARLTFARSYSILLSGKSFSQKLKILAGQSSADYATNNSNITAFKKSNTAPNMSSMTDANLISVSSGHPVYAWFDNGTIYYYSTGDIYLNEDASYMFCNMGYLSTIELDTIKTNKTTNMSHMFDFTGYFAPVFNVDLSNWDTSQVTDMSSMFSNAGNNATTWSIGDLSNWDTSKVTNMSWMFSNTQSRTWNSIGTLKVYAADISLMFNDCNYAKVKLKIYNNPTNYRSVFYKAANTSGSFITVDYKSTVTDIDSIIATKSAGSNVIKGNKFFS